MSNTQADSSGVIARIKTRLHKILSANAFDLWIKPMEWQIQGNTLILATPDRFFEAWIKTHYLKKIIRCAPEYDTVTFKIIKKQLTQKNASESQHQQLVLPGIATPNLPEGQNLKNLSPCNNQAIALAACLDLAKKKNNHAPKIIFIYGQTGAGKSHLLHATVHTAIKTGFFKSIRLKSGISFSQEVVQSAREINGCTMDQFTKKYASCDFLALDDAHLLKGKKKTQEELQNVIEYMTKKSRPIIIASTLSPTQLGEISKGKQIIQDELLSRMTSGLVFEIENATFKDRSIIILDLLKRLNLRWEKEIINYLAQNLNGDIRKTISAVHTLNAQARFSKKVTLELAAKIIGNSISTETITSTVIIEKTAQAFRLSSDDIMTKGKQQPMARTRQLASWLLVTHFGKTKSEVSRLFDQTPATVINSLKVIENHLKKDASFKKQVDFLIGQLKT
jgi:chromosomal replication initiator protein